MAELKFSQTTQSFGVSRIQRIYEVLKYKLDWNLWILSVLAGVHYEQWKGGLLKPEASDSAFQTIWKHLQHLRKKLTRALSLLLRGLQGEKMRQRQNLLIVDLFFRKEQQSAVIEHNILLNCSTVHYILINWFSSPWDFDIWFRSPKYFDELVHQSDILISCLEVHNILTSGVPVHEILTNSLYVQKIWLIVSGL